MLKKTHRDECKSKTKMKKNYFKLLALGLFAFTMNANAQCTSCTVTISAVDPTNYIVASGQTFCVTSTGNMTGLITVNAGGTVCNQGTISSPYFWVNGGTLNNYGTVNVSNLLVSTAGDYNNYLTSNHDSILIEDASSTFVNSGTMTTIRLGNAGSAVITNMGSITADYIGDSVATFNNNANSYLKILVDLYHAYNSTFVNSGFVDIDRDFLNSTGATFTTNCMISVGRDWYNAATVLGPGLTSCGGFNIVGASYNSGTIGNSSTRIDICDAGNPTWGLDGPGGTIATTTTYCTCTNVCVMPVGINESVAQSSVFIQNIYPNPSSSSLTIELQNKVSEELIVEVFDMMGRKQSSVSINSIAGLTSTSIDVSKLAQGTYILNITDSKKLQSKQLFSVVK